MTTILILTGTMLVSLGLTALHERLDAWLDDRADR